MQGSISAKKLVSGDPGSTVLGQSVSGSSNSPRLRSVVMVFRPNVPFTSFAAGAAFSSSTGTGAPATQSVTSTGFARPWIGLIMWGNHTAVTTGRTSTPAAVQIQSNAGMYGGYIIRNSTDSATNITAINMDDVGTNIMMSGAVTFTK
jgi:hypothetical protein